MPNALTHGDAWRWFTALMFMDFLSGEIPAAFIRGLTQ